MDIMGALLKGEVSKVTTEENDIVERLAFYLRRLEHRNANIAPEERPSARTRPKDARPKKKVTYYLTKLIIHHLEDAQQGLLKASEGEPKPRISKSMIVETALRMALQELDAKGPKSRLFRRVHEICHKTTKSHRVSKTPSGEEVQ
ncbi:hypothetical protein EDC27_2363 [Desulfosoma caldarium]|uniref:Uncharacterized protein n=2 Tax=Desulfosoma caldarium TaxID=610254 RepID=A0A3N1UVA8_9BACT|nr:hypothetical protein EDC27_2363 [Desulfosoma caldarium]